jgi:hypothetical protein
MPIPRKNPRTVISEEQKKLTEDTITIMPTQLGIQSARSINDTNNTKDQSLRSDNDANSTNDINAQNIQEAISTKDTSSTKDQNNDDTATIRPAPLQADKTEKLNAQSAIEVSSTKLKKLQDRQSDKGTMSTKSQNAISTNDINTQSTEDREREVYYLTPSQVDKLDDLRIAYRKATGKRLNKQDFMRHIVDSLDLNMLVQVKLSETISSKYESEKE